MSAMKRRGAPSFMPDVCNREDIQKLLNVNAANLTRLIKDGVVVKGKARGSYKPYDSLTNYQEKLRNEAAGRATSTGNTLANERAKTEVIKRKSAELKLKQLEGEILTLDEVKDGWAKFGALVKQKALAMTGQIRLAIPHLTNHDGVEIDVVVREYLADLAEEVEGLVIGGNKDDVA